jgi:hypothetical protein
MKKVIFLLGLLVLLVASVSAQEETFQPSGKVFMKVFSNFNTTISDGNTASAFELQRAYLGYDYKLSKQFSGKLNIDIGDPGVGKLQMTAYIKNAYIQYKIDKFSVQFGLIGTNSFKTMESLWGNRYIEKSFQDAYKFSASADLGVSAKYSFTDWLQADLMIVNGEGYKSLQSDDQFKSGLGISFFPIKELTVRGYYDVMGSTNTQSTASGVVAYKTKKFTAAAEYNLQQNVGNTEGKEMSGTSVYANFVPAKNVKVFARYDMLTSNTLSGENDNWNLSKNGNLMLAGVEYQATKGVKFAPNFRLWTPVDAAKANITSFFLNCEINF